MLDPCRPRGTSLRCFLQGRDPFFFRRVLIVLATALIVSSQATFTAAASIQEVTDLYRDGKYSECVESAARAIDEGSFSDNIRLIKIQAELELGRYADAQRTLDLALKSFPDSIQLRWLGRQVVRFNGQPERAELFDEEIAQLLTQLPERFADPASRVTAGRFLLSQRIDPKKVLDGLFNQVKRYQPNNVDVVLATGELALEKHDYELAGDSYQQAVKVDSTNADAQFGVAQAFAPSDPEKAEAALKLALEANPNHTPSLLMLVDEHIDSERYDEADKILDRVAKINPHHPRALAYRAVLAHLRNQAETEKLHRTAALQHWSTNPEVDHVIGLKLSQKYRFAEGEQYQRRSLQFDPNYLPAKMQLAQDLLRLGREDEGLQLAEEVYDADGYNLFAHNLVMLQENLAKFRTLEEDGLIVRMDAREAEIYGSRVLDLLKRAKRDLCSKYEVELKQPITIEIFPKQADFAIRTFGLPGGAGFLGVCFGPVITANSPAALGATPTCWEATLWHEFCHVVTLHKTNNKMPRWLSEGISVYEERQADPRWGQTINPQYREMMLSEELTPVSKLSAAFLSPKTPLHLQFAYFESSLAVEYLIEKHGLETLKRVLVDLGVGMPINDALARHSGSIEALDAEFEAFARKKAGDMAPKADWSQPELPRTPDAAAIAAWLKDHPNNYAGLQRLAEQLIADGQFQAAKEPLQRMRELYPDYADTGGALKRLAELHSKLGETVEERSVLEKLAELTDDDPTALARLLELTSQAGEWEATRKYATRWLAINPLVPAPHRSAAEAAEKLGDHDLAIQSYRAMLAMSPFDPADIHLKLANSLKGAGDLPNAKRHAMLALEETPRYRDAQRLLLEIVDGAQQDAKQVESPAEPESSIEAVQ